MTDEPVASGDGLAVGTRRGPPGPTLGRAPGPEGGFNALRALVRSQYTSTHQCTPVHQCIACTSTSTCTRVLVLELVLVLVPVLVLVLKLHLGALTPPRPRVGHYLKGPRYLSSSGS